jgi:hypothetical protein
MDMYRITYYKEFEKFYCFILASSEEEAVEKFHREITDRKPESVSECRHGISIIRARK